MTQKKVMLVDDSSMMRLIVRNLLATDPNLVIVSSADNGKQALDELPKAQPDLILLDLEMPQMDGIEFLRVARPTTKAKILILTSIAPAGSPKAAQALSLGADGIISKPSGAVSFDLEKARGSELFSTIYRLLGMASPATA
jgi:two-component system, chemotaxis family, protein-glutamate methylesterase/glutaminase